MNARQTTIFDQTPPPHNGKATSKEAAAKVFRKTWYYREKIHAFLITCGDKGATRQEIERGLGPVLGLKGDTIRPRVLELIERGLVVETTVCRATSSGCSAKVLVAL